MNIKLLKKIVAAVLVIGVNSRIAMATYAPENYAAYKESACRARCHKSDQVFVAYDRVANKCKCGPA